MRLVQHETRLLECVLHAPQHAPAEKRTIVFLPRFLSYLPLSPEIRRNFGVLIWRKNLVWAFSDSSFKASD